MCSLSIRKWNPFISHNVVRVGGRLGNASISANARHSIILPRNFHFTKLVIRCYHLLAGHSGFDHISSALSQRFWIEIGSYINRNVLKECATCQGQNAQASSQLMADLPECRLEVDRAPFFHTGVDCFGVLPVKQGGTSQAIRLYFYMHDSASCTSRDSAYSDNRFVYLRTLKIHWRKRKCWTHLL